MSHPDYAQIGSAATRLIEECSEIIKAVCKGERFGWDNHHPDRKLSNLEELRSEYHDFRDTYIELINKILANKRDAPDANSVAGCEDCGRVDGSHHPDCFAYKPRR